MIGICAAVLISFLSPCFAEKKEQEKKLFEKNSLYQYIAVIEKPEKGQRFIFNSKRDYSQGGIFVDAPDKLLFEYTRSIFISLAFLHRDPADVLFIGLGAGSMPRFFHRHFPTVSTEVAEIDPDIVDVAKKYFHFREDDTLKVHAVDGRMFVKRAKKKYDVVFLDAYQNDYIPFHLTTKEFLNEVKKKLKDGGIVVSNIVSPQRNKFFDSMITTYREVFTHFYIFKVRSMGNYIFVATTDSRKMDKDELYRNAWKVQKRMKDEIDLLTVSNQGEFHDVYEGKGDVLTDDFAPVNLYKQIRTQ